MTNRANVGKGLVVAVIGPTAVGKTRLAVKLARVIGGEIISCDSMQVYKGMPVLSQAPSRLERRNITHHLIGVLDSKREYSVASFRTRATKLIAAIIKRKKIPIIVGGSGLYIKALVDGLFPSPEADLVFRRKMETLARKRGSALLHERLSKIDPEAARKIHPNDMKRLIRALEIYHSTGKTMSELKKQTKGLTDGYKVRMFGLTMAREKLYGHINERVDRMIAAGAVTEAKRLRKKRLSKTAAMALGLRELCDHDLETARELLKRNTRRFAKRQWTWFRADKRIKWFDVSKLGDEAIVAKIRKEIKRISKR